MSLVVVSGAYANVRVPSGLPFYAALPCAEQWCVLHNDEWVVIPFYRTPECVPADFNLPNYYDVPGAFACTLTIAGFEIWEHGPGLDPEPLLMQLRGLGAVPVWFVNWTELQGAMSDGELKIGELASLSSLLRGTADSYKETMLPTGTGSIVVLQFIARGALEDERGFQVESVVYGPDLR